jgi:stearoyl-CoA desaturase (Delta-9 desaturase)
MSTAPATVASQSNFWLWFRYVLFFGMHLAVVAVVLLTNPSWPLLALCFVSYAGRMIGVSIGYHRYFAHRSFRTSRAFQFVLAVWAQTSNQNGVLWWAAHHRRHHKFSDTPDDVHSPVHHGFLQAHLTWFMLRENWAVDEKFVADWLKYPELVFLQRFPAWPTIAMAILLTATLGWDGLLWGHFVPTVFLLHCTFTINSVSHIFGTRPYDTADNSRNNALFALFTMGEGWHNNHHHRPASAAFGWRWYQFDPAWRVLWCFEKLGLVWDLKTSGEM